MQLPFPFQIAFFPGRNSAFCAAVWLPPDAAWRSEHEGPVVQLGHCMLCSGRRGGNPCLRPQCGPEMDRISPRKLRPQNNQLQLWTLSCGGLGLNPKNDTVLWTNFSGGRSSRAPGRQRSGLFFFCSPHGGLSSVWPQPGKQLVRAPFLFKQAAPPLRAKTSGADRAVCLTCTRPAEAFCQAAGGARTCTCGRHVVMLVILDGLVQT